MIVVVGMIQITYDIHTEREKGSKGREKRANVHSAQARPFGGGGIEAHELRIS